MPPNQLRTDADRELPQAVLQLRTSTIDRDKRSVEATLVTERRVRVVDRLRGRVIEEILLASGGVFPEQLPLLTNHSRSSLDDLIGSVRGFEQVSLEWRGVLYVASDDEVAARAWSKIEQGHVTDVSIGYAITKAVMVSPRTSKVINGVRYTAGELYLRIATEWRPREVSLVPIGADITTKIREAAAVAHALVIKEDCVMNPRLLAYLQKLGLDTNATDVQVREFLGSINGLQRSIAQCLDYDEADVQARTNCDLLIRTLGNDPADPSLTLPPPDAGAATTAAAPVEGTRAPAEPVVDAAAEERARIQKIRQIGANVTDSLVERAIAEGWTVERAAAPFTDDLRDRGTTVPPDHGTAPAAHIRTHEETHSRGALEAALLMRSGLDPVADAVTYQGGLPYRRQPTGNTDDLERAADAGHEFAGMAMCEIAREALLLDGFDGVPRGGARAIADYIGEQINTRSLTSGSALTRIFTTNFSAQLLAAYEVTGDTTTPWTREGRVPNFKTAERARLERGGALTKHPRGGTADHLALSDNYESFKIHRYSKQFVIDEMDLIDDRFGGLNDYSPAELGEAARQVRPDLVYSILAANAVMRDAVTLFHADHSNLKTSSALAAATIKVAVNAMNTQQENSRPLSRANGLYLITPEALSFTADQLVNSAQVMVDGGLGSKNTIRSRNITPISDQRLDNGVTDPDAGTVHAGSATTWYLARPGGRYTIEVAYLQGGSRGPVMNSFTKNDGQWLIGWGIKLDIGAKALDWRGLIKNTA